MTTTLGFSPNEDPFVVQHGGFYRRWFSMIDDIDELRATVAKLEGTTEDLWVPVWREARNRHEEEGDGLGAAQDFDGSRRAYLRAETFYAIGRFPGEITELKRTISETAVGLDLRKDLVKPSDAIGSGRTPGAQAPRPR